jgi:hypothetical protein
MPFPTPPIFLPAPVQAEADPAVTDRNVAHFQDEGRSLLLSVARPLRLADALRQRRLAPEHGRRLLHGVVAAVRPVVLSVTDALIAGSFRLAGWFRSMGSGGDGGPTSRRHGAGTGGDVRRGGMEFGHEGPTRREVPGWHA